MCTESPDQPWHPHNLIRAFSDNSRLEEYRDEYFISYLSMTLRKHAYTNILIILPDKKMLIVFIFLLKTKGMLRPHQL